MTERRPASVRTAVAKARAARLRAIERRLLGRLRYLRRHDRDGHAALVACLRRVVARADGGSGISWSGSRE